MANLLYIAMKNEALIWSLKWLIKPICSLIAGILIQLFIGEEVIK